VELVHYKKDGSWFWGRAKGQSYLTTDGETIQYFAMIEDITLEKEKEERLRVLSQIAESNINGVIIYDTQGRITWVNKSFMEMSGYSLEEIEGKTYSEIFQLPDTYSKKLEGLDKAIRKGESFSGEWIQFSKSGKYHLIKIMGQSTLDKKGEITGFFTLHEDITMERETQEKLKASEARFRLALEKIGDEVWELDFRTDKSNLPSTNPLATAKNRFFDHQYLRKRWDRVYEKDLNKVEQTFEKYISGTIDSHNIEYRIINKDKTQKWILDRGVVIEKDAYGLPLRVLGTHTDITKIKKTETKLEQRVKQFKSLSDNIPGVIYEFEFREDGTEGLRYVSPAMERVFGIKPENFYDYLNYLEPDDQARISEKNRISKENLLPFYDEARLNVPGVGIKWHAIHSSFSYISEQNAKVFTGFMMDITERKNIEDTLRANEEKYRGIIDNMELGLIEVDSKGIITYANNGFSNLSGFSIHELVGKSIDNMRDYVDHKNTILDKNFYSSPEPAAAFEIHVKTKDLGPRWWLASRAPRFDSQHRQVGSIGIYLDITEQKKLEHELIQARNQAEESAHSKEIFLANMSHEIRTPMNAIMGMSNQLTKTSLNPQQKFYLDTITSSADNLLVILNDILDISKIDAGKLSIESIGFSLDKVIERSLQVLAHKAEEKGIQLFLSDYDSKLSSVLIGDPYRLNQVLINLISNSVKFTEKGRVQIRVKLLENSTKEQVLAIEVEDTGIGMDKQFVEHLFDKFSQEYESTSRKFGGTGLGMSICKQLIELMGGEIEVESEKGKGTTIRIKIKFLKGDESDLPEKNNQPIESDFLIGKRVLITDDNHLNRLVASITLENFYALVDEAVNGKEALELIEKNTYDIILMDIQMPMMNGLDCTRAIRERGIKTPIIALTAQALKGEMEKCLKAGMNDYLSKPFKEEDLLKMMSQQLNTPSKIELSKPVENIPMNSNLYDLSNLKAISRGNEVFIKKMVGIFLDETPPVVIEMVDAFQNKNWEAMGKLAHKIKPSIDNLNIERIKTTIRSIEGVGKENKYSPELPYWIEEVNETIQNVVSGMKHEFPDLLN
jgi:PAS domain S-box-containing protein